MSRLLLALSILVLCAQFVSAGATKHTLLIALTHGDDNVSIAPLLAKYSAEGHAVYYAAFTGLQDPSGEEGSPARAEVLCASRALGVRETFVTRGPGGEAPQTVAALAERMIELIIQTKPDVIVTWGPDGLTGHPRHVLVSNIVTRVFQQQQLLEHKPRKLYYIAYPESRFHSARPPFGSISETSFGTVNDRFITTTIDGRRYLSQTREAIACHTIAKGGYGSNAQWRQAWNEHTATTLGGMVFLRLALPALGHRETDIFIAL